MIPTKISLKSRLYRLLDGHNEYQIGQRSAIYKEVQEFKDNGKSYIGLLGDNRIVAFIQDDPNIPKELFLLDVSAAIDALGRHSVVFKTTTLESRSIPVISIKTSELRKELKSQKVSYESPKPDEILVSQNDNVAWELYEQLTKAKGKNREIKLMIGDRVGVVSNVRRDKERPDILQIINQSGSVVFVVRTLTNQFPRTGEWDSVGTSPLSTDLNSAGQKLLEKIITSYGVSNKKGDHIWSIPLEPELAMRVMFGSDINGQTSSSNNADAVVYLSAAINPKGPYFVLEQGQSGTIWLKNRPPKEKDTLYPVFPVYVVKKTVMVVPVAVPFSRLMKEVTDGAPV